MAPLVLALREISRVDVDAAGGKGAHLGELSRLPGVHVPDGFCVTTAAWRRVVASSAEVRERLDALQRGGGGTPLAVAAELRGIIHGLPLPADVEHAITTAHQALGVQDACAVRSSATSEDLPSSSSAGLMDSFLDVVGTASVLDHVRRCWASLFTDRAVLHRAQHGVDPRTVQMAVLVQRMVRAEAAGVLFTADPVTGDRTVTTVEAVPGRGDALVSGHVNAARYRLRSGQFLERPSVSLLADAALLQLEALGRLVEKHFRAPQDVEWCLAGETVSVVQSRPITTLFPVPGADDEGRHVYVSVGHQQMMTDAIRPLGVSLWQLTAARPMFTAGGRLFVDVVRELSSPATRAMFLDPRGGFDPLTRDALGTLIRRGDFLPEAPAPGGPPRGAPPAAAGEPDPAITRELIARNDDGVAECALNIRQHTGAALIRFIMEDAQFLKRSSADGKNMTALLAFMNAARWLNDRMEEWLGEKNAADTLAQSVPDNVTSEMGLALLDVADVARRHPQVAAYLAHATDDGFLAGLRELDGGREFHDVMRAFLDRHGMRCPGEIDVTRTRWAESPTALVPLILANVRNFPDGEAARRFQAGRQEAARKEQALLERLRQLPGGEQKVEETRRMIARLRNFAGYREHPKYTMVRRYFLYRQALLEEAARLVSAGVLEDREDIFFLSFPELLDVVTTRSAERQLLQQRRAEHARNTRLVPPRVITSDGEVLHGAYPRTEGRANVLPGLAVSAGVVEGRARVVTDLARAHLEPGDILVTAFTDPAWTPLFVSARGLVTEVGGVMTHGAVIAREYGLPAVVAVDGATRRVRDGQRIRVNGTEGWVELLD